MIDEWYTVQRAWMYLENIFSAEDIQRQLPSEAAKFKQAPLTLKTHLEVEPATGFRWFSLRTRRSLMVLQNSSDIFGWF